MNLQKIVTILDATPRYQVRQGSVAPPRERVRGQSMVELALVTPLLILMIAGIVELGALANNYLILLEVTRVGARTGSVLSGQVGPLEWNNLASVHPVVYAKLGGTTWTMQDGTSYTVPSTPPNEALITRDCSPSAPGGFYNGIACLMIDSMEPLVMRGRAPNGNTDEVKLVLDRSGNVIDTVPFPDDIIISVFSIAAVNNADPASLNGCNAASLAAMGFRTEEECFSVFRRTYDFNALDDSRARPHRYGDGFQTIVTARYPINANECNGDAGNPVVDDDPMDYIRDGLLTTGLYRHARGSLRGSRHG